MRIKGDTFEVGFDPATITLAFKGTIRLRGPDEYAPIVELMNKTADGAPQVITLDLQELNFLNSAGINILFGYVIKVRDQARSRLVVRGANHMLWQTKSLPNLKQLMPKVQLEMV